MQRNERILVVAAGLLLLSILLMLIIIPGVYTRSLPDENNSGAVIGISLAVIIRLLIFIWYFSILKKNRREGEKRKAGYIVIGILLIIFGTIYMDGAFAFLNNDNIFYVSMLMFGSILCDYVSAILAIILFILKPQKTD
jgi:O-antigen ligase